MLYNGAQIQMVFCLLQQKQQQAKQERLQRFNQHVEELKVSLKQDNANTMAGCVPLMPQRYVVYCCDLKYSLQKRMTDRAAWS